MLWVELNQVPWDALGLIPSFLSPDDERPAAEQIASNYCGGWDSFKGFTFNPDTWALSYPGDPDLLPLFTATLRGEAIIVYQSGFTAILQPDGSFDVARLD